MERIGVRIEFVRSSADFDEFQNSTFPFSHLTLWARLRTSALLTKKLVARNVEVCIAENREALKLSSCHTGLDTMSWFCS